MGRIARAVAPGWPHHITQRGNRRMQVFFSDDDYGLYLELMSASCGKLKSRTVAVFPVTRSLPIGDQDANYNVMMLIEWRDHSLPEKTFPHFNGPTSMSTGRLSMG